MIYIPKKKKKKPSVQKQYKNLKRTFLASQKVK